MPTFPSSASVSGESTTTLTLTGSADGRYDDRVQFVPVSVSFVGDVPVCVAVADNGLGPALFNGGARTQSMPWTLSVQAALAMASAPQFFLGADGNAKFAGQLRRCECRLADAAVRHRAPDAFDSVTVQLNSTLGTLSPSGSGASSLSSQSVSLTGNCSWAASLLLATLYTPPSAVSSATSVSFSLDPLSIAMVSPSVVAALVVRVEADSLQTPALATNLTIAVPSSTSLATQSQAALLGVSLSANDSVR